MQYNFDDMINRIKTIKKSKGITNMQLAKLSGVPYGTLNKILGSETKDPSINAIIKIANVLDVSADFLITGNIYENSKQITPDNLLEKQQETTSQNIVKSDEIEHIKKYRTLDEHGKRIVDFNLDEEYRRMTNNKVIYESDLEQQEQFADIPFYPIGASAGTGLWLFDDIECITIQIPYTDESRRADFALPVRGDSMKPKYHDGDLLLVRQQPSINIGEIGIFVLNDESYVKKQGDHELISLNDNYDNINVSEFDSIDCKGKVVGYIPAEEAKKYLP